MNEIGDIKKIVYKEQKIFSLHDDSNIIDHTFFTELNKRVQPYGLISVEFHKNKKELITTNNLLKVNFKHNIKKEKITLQLQNILNPNGIKTIDSKTHNFSILLTKKEGSIGSRRKMQRIIDEFKIEVFKVLINIQKLTQ